jgi:hypothetical protein
MSMFTLPSLRNIYVLVKEQEQLLNMNEEQFLANFWSYCMPYETMLLS